MPLEKGRRSSILKPSKARNPLGELDQLRPSDNNEEDGATTTETIRNRRVSFSHKKGVALFTSEEGNTIWHNIYEEHNKPDLSDSGGSHLHISVDDDNLNIKQENKMNRTLPIFNTNNDDDEEEDEHCVDIQAMLSGFKRPVDNKVTPNLVLELTQPSITEQTDILINYKIPHEEEPLSYIKSEEVKVKVESEGDILFNESQAEMSITQDLPVIIVTNETNKVNKIKKAPFDISMVEDKTKWSEDKENIVIQGCSYNIEEQVKVEMEEHICVKEEYHNIKNESLHIEDFYSFGAKRSIADTSNVQDIPDKKIKTESIHINTVKNEVYTNNALVSEEDVSMTYCFTKEIKMNNKRETIGYNVKELDISLTCPNYIEMDPLADIKTPIDLPIESKGPSGILDNSIDNAGQDKNFEFVECNNFYDSRNIEDLDKSDFLKLNEDCKVNIVPKNSPNENDCNASMSDIVSAMTQSLDRGEYTNKTLGPQIPSKSNDYISDKPKTDTKPVNVPVIHEKSKTALDSEISDFYMTSSIPFRPNVQSDSKIIQDNNLKTNVSHGLTTNIEKNSNVITSMCDVTMKTAENIPINQIHFNEVKSKNLQHENNKSKLDFPNKVINRDESGDDRRKSTNFIHNVPEKNMTMLETVSVQQITSTRNPILPEISKEIINTGSATIDSNNATDKRRTIHFNENMSEFDMSMTSVAPIQNKEVDKTNKEDLGEFDMSMTCGVPIQTACDDNTNKRRTIHFNENMAEFDMSMTSVAPLHSKSEDNENKRRTIHFNENMPDFDMSMTNVAPIQTVSDDNTNKRRTIHFNENMPEFDMSMTSVAPIQSKSEDNENKRRTIHFNENMPDFDMSMTNVAPIQTVSDDNTNKRRTIHFNENMAEFDMSMTSVAPLHSKSEDNENKRRTIHFNENMPDFDMSMTNVAPIQTSSDDNTNKRRTIHFNENMAEFDMSMTNVIPKQLKPIDNSEKHTTIHFNKDMPECDMSMTGVAPTQIKEVDQTNKENIPKFGMSIKPDGGINKRRTIHFNEDMPEFDMSMTGVAPIQIKSEGNAINEDMPKIDMSITGIVPIQEKVANKSNKEDTPEIDMSVTGIVPRTNDNTNKRKTIHFNEMMPEFDMSMTGIAPIQEKVAYKEDMPEIDMSITGIVPIQEKVANKSNKEDMPEIDMSVTGIVPRTNDNTNERKTIHFNEMMPEFDMSMTGIAPIQEKVAYKEDMPEIDMSITGIAPLPAIMNDNTNKRRTIHFNENMPEFDMSMTGIAPIQTKSEGNANKEDIPEIDMSITGIAPLPIITNDNTNKRRTIHFNENMPEFDMSMTGIAPIQTKSEGNANKEDIPEIDMSITGILPIQTITNDNTNKRRTIHFNESIPEFDMSMTGIAPIETKSEGNANKEDMPEIDMSITGIAPLPTITNDNTNKRRTFHFNESMPELDMSITGVVPINPNLDNISNGKTVLSTKGTEEDVLSSPNQITAPRIDDGNTNERSSSCKLDGSIKTKSPVGMDTLKDKEDIFDSRKSTLKNNEGLGNKFNTLQNQKEGLSLVRDAVSIDLPKSTERMSIRINVKEANNENISKFIETSEFKIADKNNTLKSPINNRKSCIEEKSTDKSNNKEQMTYHSNSFVKNELAKIQSLDSKIPNISYGNQPERSNKVQDLVETIEEKPTRTEVNYEVRSLNVFKESTENQHKIDKKLPMNAYCQNVSLDRDNLESVHENYFEQGCAGLLHNSKLVNDSYMSVSGIAPRIPPKMNSFNCTFSNVSYFNPNIDESKSVLFTKNFAPEKIMEISKCYEGYRDPCKSANNSIFGGDKSNLSLPNIDESDMDFQVMNESTSEVIQMENKLNITSDNSASINDKTSNTENTHKIPEKDKTMDKNDPLCPEKTLPSINAMSSRIITNIDEVVDDFHMSVDEINISMHENVECAKILHKTTDVSIVDKKDNLKELVEECKFSNHEKSIHNPPINADKSTSIVVSNIESKSENVILQVATTISSETKESLVNLNSEQKDCSVATYQNTTQKNYFDLEDGKKSDSSLTKGSEKRKSDSDMTKDSLNHPKKQKIVVPEVCLWLKEISIDKTTTQSVDSSKLEQPEKSINSNEDVDSQTYVISRGQMEHFAKIKEMNDDVHDRLNSSDHFIENVNMSLVDSSLDKSNEYKKCSRTEEENEVNNLHSDKREESNCEMKNLENDGINKSIAMTQNILEESVRTSTDTNQSFVCEIKPTVPAAESKPTLRKMVEDYVSNLEMCDVIFENREIIFSLMDGHVLVKVSLSEDMSKDGENTDIHIADISVEQKPTSASGPMNTLLDVASKMVLVDLDTRWLKSSFVVSGEMIQMVEKCWQVTDKAWQWLKTCYSLYVKYNLKLVDEYKWTFEICDGFHLCAWDIEIKLQSKRILHCAKSDNIRIKTSVGRSRITDSMFRDVLDGVAMGWTFLPEVVSKIHNLIVDTRHLASKS